MKKYAKLFIAGFLLTGCLSSLIGISFKSNNLEVAEAAAHTTNFADYKYDGNYYSFLPSSYSDGLNGTLRTTLSANILPKSWPVYSSSGTNHLSTVLQYADEDPTNSNNMVYLYTRDSKTKNAAKDWNREHVWPQSLSNNNWGQSNAGTDLLHLRPTYNDTNSKRGNDKYGYVSGSWLKYNGMDYGKSSGGKFEPLDSVKGDVARIIMYVWVAYKNYYSTLPDVTRVFESYNTLLEWHTLDKPDAMEGHRNDYSEKQSMQKNRNPFVDHPEYAWEIFGDNASESVVNACKEVYPANGSSTSLRLSSSSVSISTGGTSTISVTTSGVTSVSWSTSNPSVATVDNGKITGVSAGNAIITATATVDGKTCSATCSVTVTKGDTPTPPTPTPAGNGTLENPYKPSQARDPSVLGQAFIKGEAHNINYNGANVTLSLFDVGNVTGQTGINVIDLDASNLKIEDGDIVILKATKGDKNSKWIAPGYVYSVEKKSGGCSGSIITSSIILFSTALVGLSAVIIRKKKEEK